MILSLMTLSDTTTLSIKTLGAEYCYRLCSYADYFNDCPHSLSVNILSDAFKPIMLNTITPMITINPFLLGVIMLSVTIKAILMIVIILSVTNQL
jgi:hypothetical protein